MRRVRGYAGLGAGLMVLGLVILMVGLGGCGGSSDCNTRQVITVTVTDMDSFYPNDISVLPGTEIVFVNRDTDPHTATADLDNANPNGPNSAGKFPAGLGPGDTYVFRVPNAPAGTNWFYHCCNHGAAGDGTTFGAGMSGVIRVVSQLGPTFDVTMTDQDSFDPTTLTVPAGATVVWTNQDTDPHTATVDLDNVTPSGPNSAFEFPRGLPTHATFQWQVPGDAPVGTQWFYHCCNHGQAGDGTTLGAGMSGVIVVGDPQ